MSEYLNRQEKSVIEKISNVKRNLSFFLTFVIVLVFFTGTYFIFDLGSFNFIENIEKYHKVINVFFYIYFGYLIFAKDTFFAIKLFAIGFIFFFNQSIMNTIYLWLLPFVFGFQILGLTSVLSYLLSLFIFLKLDSLNLIWLNEWARKSVLERPVRNRKQRNKKIKNKKNFGKNKKV